MIPIRTSSPVHRTPWANYALIAVNVLVFAAQSLFGGSEGQSTSLAEWLELGILDGSDPQLYQFVTYQFLHGGLAHVGGNMLFLWVFGNPVNSKMGNWTYLLFYLATGVFAAAAYSLTTDSGMLGASGAVAGITTAYLALFPRSHITILYWWIIIGTIELPSMVMIVFKMIVWDNIIGPQFIEGGGSAARVAFGAHLAGYAFGFVVVGLMLAFRLLPRDQFDMVALLRRWSQRRAMRDVMADPTARAAAQYGRVARPVTVDAVGLRPVVNERQDQVSQLRMRIAESLSLGDRDTAADLYEKLTALDPRQVLAKPQQLEVANQLYTLNRLAQAANAYEKFLGQYPTAPEAAHVKLLLGIIYARDLQQYEAAEQHLTGALSGMMDDRRREQALHWLKVSAEALGRGSA